MAIDPQMQAADVSSPWAELRRYEQAKEDGTAPEFSFDDLIDVVNPLQHIPVVSTIYREITGDEIAGAPRIVGGGIFGGVGGFVSGLVNAITEEATGQDLGGHVMVAMGMSDGDDTGSSQVAKTEATADPQLAAQQAAATQTKTAPTMPEDAQATAAGEPAQTNSASAQPAPAKTAAAANDSQLTGQAALQALARDLRTGGNQQAAETASKATSAAPESTSANAAAAPKNFMPIRDRDQLWGIGPRRTAAALRAEADLMGSKRLQGAAPSSQAIKTQPRDAQTPSATAAETAPQSRTAAEPAKTTRQAMPASSETPESGGFASSGDFAERMKRALDKYESLRNSN